MKSRSRNSAQDDKCSFCLTAVKIDPRIRRDNEQTSAPEPHTGRRFALDLVRSLKASGSIKTRRKRAGSNTDFLLRVLQLDR